MLGGISGREATEELSMTPNAFEKTTSQKDVSLSILVGQCLFDGVPIFCPARDNWKSTTQPFSWAPAWKIKGTELKRMQTT